MARAQLDMAERNKEQAMENQGPTHFDTVRLRHLFRGSFIPSPLLNWAGRQASVRRCSMALANRGAPVVK